MRRVQDCPHQEDRNILLPVHLIMGVRAEGLDNANGGRVTESRQVVLEIIGEMVALPCGFIVELDIHDMVGVLVGGFDHTNQVERYG